MDLLPRLRKARRGHKPAGPCAPRFRAAGLVKPTGLGACLGALRAAIIS